MGVFHIVTHLCSTFLPTNSHNLPSFLPHTVWAHYSTKTVFQLPPTCRGRVRNSGHFFRSCTLSGNCRKYFRTHVTLLIQSLWVQGLSCCYFRFQKKNGIKKCGIFARGPEFRPLCGGSEISTQKGYSRYVKLDSLTQGEVTIVWNAWIRKRRSICGGNKQNVHIHRIFPPCPSIWSQAAMSHTSWSHPKHSLPYVPRSC